MTVISLIVQILYDGLHYFGGIRKVIGKTLRDDPVFYNKLTLVIGENSGVVIREIG